MKILLVEDCAITSALLQLHLKRLGHEVIAVSSVAGALQHLTTEHQFEAMVLDTQLPLGGTGLDILQYIDGIDPPPTLLHSSEETLQYEGETISLYEAVEIFDFAVFHPKSDVGDVEYITRFLRSIESK